VGDFIVVNDVAGTIEFVGLKSTRIRSLGGEQIVMSNTDLLKQTISNYKRLQERRIVYTFGITYDATPAQAEEVPRIVKRVIESSSKLRFDRAHLLSFGESSLDYEVVFLVLDPDYNVYMDERQALNPQAHGRVRCHWRAIRVSDAHGSSGQHAEDTEGCRPSSADIA
jgi:small-conductance mechanosensitive channel